MKVSSARQGERLVFAFDPGDDDRAYYAPRKGRLNQQTVSLPCGDLHPDLQALTALLIGGAFTAKHFELDRAVSQPFADVVRESFKRIVTPVDEALVPRPPGTRDALAFSGGVDSVAALMLMPEDTIAMFLHRVSEADVRSAYSAEAALRSCEAVRAMGRPVMISETDLELVRNPVGFPVDWSNAAPAVAMADQLGLRSVAFGMIAESAFQLGHQSYSDLRQRAVYRAWAPLFDRVGVSISLPTAGLSEVTTARIAASVPQARPQSCVRGSADTPCGTCFKCFRKILLDSAVSGKPVPPSHFDGLTKAVRLKLSERPIHHEAVLAYSIHKMPPVDHPLYRALKALTQPGVDRHGLDYMERLFPVGLDYVLPAHRDAVARQIGRFSNRMEPDEAERIVGWTIEDIVASDEYAAAAERVRRVVAGGGIEPPTCGL